MLPAIEENYIGVYYGPNKINIRTQDDDAVNWDIDFSGYETFYPTLYHELWHRFQDISGVFEGNPYTLRNKWIIEGTAELAPFMFGLDGQHSLRFMGSYLRMPEKHAITYFDTSYAASLYLYYLWKIKNKPEIVRDLLIAFGQQKDAITPAESLGFNSYWKDFTKRMWNKEPIDPIKIEGTTIGWHSMGDISDEPSQPTPSALLRCQPDKGVKDTSLEFSKLAPMSWRAVRITTHAMDIEEYCSIYLNEYGDNPDAIVHAFISDTSDSPAKYRDWTGKSHVRICKKTGKVCEQAEFADAKFVDLIIANKSYRDDIEGTIGAGALPSSWLLTKVKLNEVVVSKARGLSLEFGTGGGC